MAGKYDTDSPLKRYLQADKNKFSCVQKTGFFLKNPVFPKNLCFRSTANWYERCWQDCEAILSLAEETGITGERPVRMKIFLTSKALFKPAATVFLSDEEPRLLFQSGRIMKTFQRSQICLATAEHFEIFEKQTLSETKQGMMPVWFIDCTADWKPVLFFCFQCEWI